MDYSIRATPPAINRMKFIYPNKGAYGKDFAPTVPHRAQPADAILADPD
jgi:hypothetical protein